MCNPRARIGLIVSLSNTVCEPEMVTLCLEGVSTYATRIKSEGITKSGYGPCRQRYLDPSQSPPSHFHVYFCLHAHFKNLLTAKVSHLNVKEHLVLKRDGAFLHRRDTWNLKVAPTKNWDLVVAGANDFRLKVSTTDELCRPGTNLCQLKPGLFRVGLSDSLCVVFLF